MDERKNVLEGSMNTGKEILGEPGHISGRRKPLTQPRKLTLDR